MNLFGDAKKILVTGGAGFIGSHLTDMLIADGCQVTVFDDLSHAKKRHFEHNLNHPQFHLIHGSLEQGRISPEFMEGHELVIHLASNTNLTEGYEKPTRDMKDLQVTSNLLESMRAAGVKDVIFSSSGAVYGNDCKDKYLSESHGPLQPESTYAASKIASEALITAYCRLYELRGWIFRFGNVIGGRMTHGVMLDFMKRLKSNPENLTIRGDGKQEKHYLLVEHVVEGMAYIYRHIKDIPCVLLNLAPATVTNVVRIAEIIAEELDIRPRITITGEVIAWPGDQPRVHLNVEKLKSYGYTVPISSDEAVRQAIRRLM